MGNCTQICQTGLQNEKELIISDSPSGLKVEKEFFICTDNENVDDPLYGQISVMNHLKVMKEEYKGFKLALKKFTYNDNEDYKQALSFYESRFYGFNHPNLLIIHLMENKKIEDFFNTTYIIKLYMDYPEQTFAQELLLRHRLRFSEAELLYFLDSIVGALAFLQSKGLSHQRLSFNDIFLVQLLNGTQCIKIADPAYYNNRPTPFLSVLENKEHPSEITYFFSPEQLQILYKGEKCNYNEYKSDVFTLGMILLQLCTNSNCAQLYDFLNGMVQEDLINELLSKVSKKYSEQMFDLLCLMLQFQVKRRPDLIDLDELLGTYFTELTNKRIANTWQYQDFQYTLNDQKQAKSDIQLQKRSIVPLVHPENKKTARNQNGQRQLSKNSSIKNYDFDGSVQSIPDPMGVQDQLSIARDKEKY